MIYREPPPDLPLFARRTDPATSHEAGRNAAAKHPDSEAASWVMQVVGADPLNDEEIYERVKAKGCSLTPQRIRAGRLHAAKLGMVVEAGRSRMASGDLGRTWVRRLTP